MEDSETHYIRDRYNRHLICPRFNEEKQLKLCKSSILVIGVGGLGCTVCTQLVSSGITKLTIVEPDTISLNNLHRQFLYNESHIGFSKGSIALNMLNQINPTCKIEVIYEHFNYKNADRIISQCKYDAIVDCTDNISSRFFINDIAVLYDLPLISGACLSSHGQLSVYNYHTSEYRGPCYRCINSDLPDLDNALTSSQVGILGPIPAIVGALQVMEIIKVITGFGEPLSERILFFDGEAGEFLVGKLRGKCDKCIVCGKNRSIFSAKDSAMSLGLI